MRLSSLFISTTDTESAIYAHMTQTGVMNTAEVPEATMADTLNPFDGTGTTRDCCMAGPSMKLLGTVGAPATGKTNVGVVGLFGDGGSGAMVTQTLLVVFPLVNSA